MHAEKNITMIIRQWRLSLLGGGVLLLAFIIPYLFPQWDVYVAKFLRTHLLFVGALLCLLLFLLLWKYPQRQVVDVRDRKDRLDLESKSRQTLIQFVGGVALLGGLFFTAQTLRTSQETLQVNQKTLETARQGQMTERFTKAIEQLGDKERLMVRLGGIYALERIARDSESDYWPVMEVLTAFVREQAQARTVPPGKTSGEDDTKESLHKRKLRADIQELRADIQAILTVIGRRTRTYGNGEVHRLDLHNTNLQGADLNGAQLQGAYLRGVQLQEASLIGTQLQGANLSEAQLQGAGLVNAQLQGASLVNAQLQGAYLTGAQLRGTGLTGVQLQGAYLMGAQLQGANLGESQIKLDIGPRMQLIFPIRGVAQLQGADLRKTINLTQDQIDKACVDENTKLPEGLTRPASYPNP
jgi:uncharacterized protein YjbI with pentapeptide repeats